ncbi:uncharacterized protein F5891DRAFT_1000895 [Suillus fuscotomentosus]|uniref:Uncharacterized protein n=1 Tax=Suillus fuscotomentosus TaxID=1912939 RepID=A0AAD4ELM3_9AGAM|nr:uncharacterized protein F5891DRAFT_1000895 [Suillus fuscotomentosus]KAG1907279.1 hypothetical protein F5891DRAFT_1000895 [Suillus fuscotomentosus]
MDKSSKNDFIQAYLDRQKVYVHSYSSIDPPSKITNGTPTRARDEETKKLKFGFDTPILVPRVAGLNILSTDKRSVVGLPTKATQKTRKTQKALNVETSIKENKDSVRAPLITARRDSSKRKRKKAEVPFGSDEEREARLSERRERKRVKRDIVKPNTNIAVHVSPSASEKEYKKVARKKGKKHSGTAGLALLHGFSATNVGKNRLTLKPLASLGVFNKGKSSAKTKIYKTKEPAHKLFSEIAFLNKTVTTKQYESPVDESVVSDSSSRPPSAVKKIKITNHRKDRKSTQSTSNHSASPDLPRGSTAISEPWDIELQSKCPSSDGFCPQPGKSITGTLVLDPRMANWHDQELPSEGQVIHSSLIKTPVKEMSHDCIPDEILSSVSASVIATIYDLDGGSSIHPSHSASQVGLKRLGRLNPSVELLTSKYFAVHDTEHVSPTFDQPHPITNSCGVISGCNPRDAHLSVSHPHDTSTTRRAAPLNVMVDSSPLRIHGIPEEHFLPLADDLMPTYRGHSITQYSRSNEDVISAWYAPDACTTNFFGGDSGHDDDDIRDQDLVYLEPPHLVDEPSFYSLVQAYSSDGLHDISADEMVVLDEPCQGLRKLIEYTQEVDDYEDSDLALELSSLHHDSFSSPTRSHATAEAYDDDSCSLRPFLQGRAMLLGIPPYVPPWHDPHDHEHTKFGSGLLSAEVDVAKRLKDHWRPHRL